MLWVNANIKKRKCLRVKKKSVKINLKFQMEENYKHIRKYPSGCCWLYCILPPAMSPRKLPPSDGRVSGPQNSCSFAALSTTFRTTTFGQLLCSACCFQEGSGSSDIFSSWIQSYFCSSVVERLTASKGTFCHWLQPIDHERLEVEPAPVGAEWSRGAENA